MWDLWTRMTPMPLNASGRRSHRWLPKNLHVCLTFCFFLPLRFHFSIVSLSGGCGLTSCSMWLLRRVVWLAVRDDAGVAWLLMRPHFPEFVFCSHRGAGTNEPVRAFGILFLTTCLFSSFYLPLFLNSQTLNFSESKLLFTRPQWAETGFSCSFFQGHPVNSLASVPFVTSQWDNHRTVYFSTARIDCSCLNRRKNNWTKQTIILIYRTAMYFLYPWWVFQFSASSFVCRVMYLFVLTWKLFQPLSSNLPETKSLSVDTQPD